VQVLNRKPYSVSVVLSVLHNVQSVQQPSNDASRRRWIGAGGAFDGDGLGTMAILNEIQCESSLKVFKCFADG
jgi:hypothetical protein